LWSTVVDCVVKVTPTGLDHMVSWMSSFVCQQHMTL